LAGSQASEILEEVPRVFVFFCCVRHSIPPSALQPSPFCTQGFLTRSVFLRHPQQRTWDTLWPAPSADFFFSSFQVATLHPTILLLSSFFFPSLLFHSLTADPPRSASMCRHTRPLCFFPAPLPRSSPSRRCGMTFARTGLLLAASERESFVHSLQAPSS